MNKEEIIALVDERIMNITNQSLEMLRHFAREHQHVISENTGAMANGAKQALLEARKLVDSVQQESMLRDAREIRKDLNWAVERASCISTLLSEDLDRIENLAFAEAKSKLINAMSKAFDKLEDVDYD